MRSGECHTQSVKVDEQLTLLGGIQVHLQPAPFLIFDVIKSF
jgi:hypothetical protein